MALESLESFTPSSVVPDWHDTQTIQLGELMDAGFDPFGHTQWTEAGWYSTEVRERIENKIALRYRYYELAITPPGKWRDMLTAHALMVVPKYTPFYKALDNGGDISREGDRWLKNRSVYSDFPATQLDAGLHDYASNGTDFQQEEITQGDLMNRLQRLTDYQDIDARLVEEFHTFFSQLADTIVRW